MIFKSEQETIPEIRPLLKKTTVVRKEKPKKINKGSRRSIVALFILTLVASVSLWFYPEIAKTWQQVSQPLVIGELPQEKKFDAQPVLAEVQNLTKDLRGTYGIYVRQLGDSHEYGTHQSEAFPAASLMKLPVILTLYREVEQGRVDLETKYSLFEKDKIGGAGILQGRPAGSTYTYRQLAEFIAQYSDNTANHVISRALGQEKIQQMIKDLGMSRTSFKDYTTTPEDIGVFFRKLYQGKLVNTGHREEILKFLTKTGFENRIPAGIPTDIRVAHKIGTEIGTFSDGGIVFAQKPFILVIMSKDARESEAVDVLPKIAKAVWEFENSL